MGFSLWKQLRKRLRRGRRAGGWQLAAVLAIAAVGCGAAPAYADAAGGFGTAAAASDAAGFGESGFGAAGEAVPRRDADVRSRGMNGAPEEERGDASAKPGLLDKLRASDAPFTVRLKRIYLCGEESTQLGKLSGEETIALLRRNPGWTAVLAGDGAVVFEERVNDLSPACKESAVFGIDKEGYLSLFDGPPERNKVLRTFFQLDVNYMESTLPHDRLDALEHGIRISDVDEFNSVLSSFSDFAAPAGTKAFRSTY